MNSKIGYYLSPILSAWLIVVYMHVVQHAGMQGYITSLKLFLVAFIPVVLMEILFSLYFQKTYRKHYEFSYRSSGNDTKAIFVNIIIWFGFYSLWVIYICTQTNSCLKWYIPNFFIFSAIIWRAMTVIGLVSLAIWLLLYYIITVRMRAFRIMTSVAPFFVITLFMFCYQYYYGGAGQATSQDITSQAGVEQVLSNEEIKKALTPVTNNDYLMLAPTGTKRIGHAGSIELKYMPGQIFVDDNVFFTVFNSSRFSNSNTIPVVLRKDLNSKNISYILDTRNLKQIDAHTNTILIAPWQDSNIYELSKKDLSVIREIFNQTEKQLSYWQPMCVLKDDKTKKIYVANGIHPAIVSYDLSSGKLINILDLQSLGLVGQGGSISYLIKSERFNKLYFIASPSEYDLFAIDPDSLGITGQLDLNDIIPASITSDDETGYLYYQSGLFDSLYKINLEQLQVSAKYKGDFFAKQLQLDKKRNALYVLSTIKGKIFALDLNTANRVWERKIGGNPTGMAISNDSLWINSMSGAFKLDLTTIWKNL